MSKFNDNTVQKHIQAAEQSYIDTCVLATADEKYKDAKMREATAFNKMNKVDYDASEYSVAKIATLDAWDNAWNLAAAKTGYNEIKSKCREIYSKYKDASFSSSNETDYPLFPSWNYCVCGIDNSCGYNRNCPICICGKGFGVCKGCGVEHCCRGEGCADNLQMCNYYALCTNECYEYDSFGYELYDEDLLDSLQSYVESSTESAERCAANVITAKDKYDTAKKAVDVATANAEDAEDAGDMILCGLTAQLAEDSAIQVALAEAMYNHHKKIATKAADLAIHYEDRYNAAKKALEKPPIDF
jgi:hypothetical protein